MVRHGEGDPQRRVEVKEPKYWFKWTKTGKKLKLQIADGYVEGFSVDL